MKSEDYSKIVEQVKALSDADREALLTYLRSLTGSAGSSRPPAACRRDVRNDIVFIFVNGLFGNTRTVCKLLLGDVFLYANLTDAITYGHGGYLLFELYYNR